jgi:hypothetical protein
LTVGEYWYLDHLDVCYYIWERVSGATYDQFPTNSFIKNLQIPPSVRGQNRWYFKEQAVSHAARAVGAFIPEDGRRTLTFVPIPPSFTRDDPAHDERLLWVLRSIHPPLADVRELILQVSNMPSKGKQISPAERAANYIINPECAEPAPSNIVLFDDVLTTGSHFKGAVMVLKERYPDVRIIGLFLARATRPDVFPTPPDDIPL